MSNLYVPKNTEKRLKLAVFWIFWVKKTKIRKKILWSTCKYDLLVIGEAFWGSWEQWTQSKYQKTAKNSVFGHKKLRQIAPVKNQPQRPLLPFSRVHLGPICKIPARQKIFFFFLRYLLGWLLTDNRPIHITKNYATPVTYKHEYETNEGNSFIEVPFTPWRWNLGRAHLSYRLYFLFLLYWSGLVA